MALDACFLQFAANELNDVLSGEIVDKIYQPSKDEVLLHLRGKGKHRLMISSSPNSARILYGTAQASDGGAPFKGQHPRL